jgi:outer membrane protein TolC
MFNRALVMLAVAAGARAEVRPMTLRQTVTLAIQQNPDVALARLDEEMARLAVRLAKDPFTPRVTVGSGLAYTYGFPMSVEGSAPSIVQARASSFIFNRQQNYIVAQAKEDARGAGIGVAGKRDEVAFRTASLYLDAERATRAGELARKDAESLAKVLDTVRAQVAEGRALPLAEKQAAYNVARARQTAEILESDELAAQTALALAIGLTADDRVRPVEEQRPAPPAPAMDERAISAALERNPELRRLQSQIAARGLEARGERAARLPRVDLIAQYGLFAKYNNYADYFQRFQRNNGQIGASFQIPLFIGGHVSAEAAQTEAEIAKLRVQLTRARNQLSADLQGSARDVKKAETAAEVARLDLDVAREQLSVYLAQMQEGRAGMRQVEEAKITENAKWIAFYDAQYALEKARWNALRLTGELVGAIQSLP